MTIGRIRRLDESAGGRGGMRWRGPCGDGQVLVSPLRLPMAAVARLGGSARATPSLAGRKWRRARPLTTLAPPALPLLGGRGPTHGSSRAVGGIGPGLDGVFEGLGLLGFRNPGELLGKLVELGGKATPLGLGLFDALENPADVAAAKEGRLHGHASDGGSDPMLSLLGRLVVGTGIFRGASHRSRIGQPTRWLSVDGASWYDRPIAM